MNRELLPTLVILAFLATLAVSAFSADQSHDEGAIRNLEEGLQQAWNHHDAKTFASFFTENADCMNVVGWWWRGRTQIESKVAEAHLFMFRDSALTNDEIHVRFLTPRSP